MIRLLLHSRANKMLELNLLNNEYQIKNIYASEEEELKYHTSFSIPPLNIKYNGSYTVGVNNDILMFFVINGILKIKYKELVYDLLDDKLEYKCNQIAEKEWVFECISSNNGFKFYYQAYTYCPFDDIDETDVNFGLWLISILKNRDRLNHTIKAFST
jgi:hypothetical protein